MIDELTPIGRLVRHYPAATRSVLGWYGISVADDQWTESLGAVCDSHGVDVDDLLVDLRAQVEDD